MTEPPAQSARLVRYVVAVIAAFALLPSSPRLYCVAAAAPSEIDGVATHRVASPYQSDTTEVRVLMPRDLPLTMRIPAIYVLPVEPRDEHRYGDGLAEIARHQLHQKHGVLFVAPSFSALPWYADHPSDPQFAQESHFVKVVVPLIDKTYPTVAERRGRLLLGFSKSGWGAMTLLLRHPELFDRAAAWDAPLWLDEPGRYGSGEIFGTPENFRRYQVSALLTSRARQLGNEPRLILAGHGAFAADHEQAHQLLERLQVPHIYLDGPTRQHDWHSGWVTPTVEQLLSPAR